MINCCSRDWFIGWFRSGPTDSDKVCLNLDADESSERNFTTNEVDRVKETASPTTGRKSDMEALKLALARTAALKTQQIKNSILSTTSEVTPNPADKKLHKKQPTGTFEYSVEDGDTLVRIGARFDVTPSELIKVNKLLSRTVFVGQILYIPDPRLTDSSPIPNSSFPVPPVSAPHLDSSFINLPSLSDCTAQVVSTALPVSTVEEQATDSLPHKKADTPEDKNKEHEKFLKMPVRRVLDEEQRLAASEGFTVKGTLLVTPISIMFDPDVCDPVIISCEDPQKFRAVIYMEELKSAALFHDISPRMFWRQPKEVRAHTAKPETYRSGQDKKPKDEDHHEEVTEPTSQLSQENTSTNRLEPVGAEFDRDHSKPVVPTNVGNTVDVWEEDIAVDVTTQHLEDMNQKITPCESQHGRLSENRGHTLSSSKEHLSSSPIIMTSGSPERIMCTEHCQENPAVAGTQDVQPLGDKQPSEIHIPSSGDHVRISDPSPADINSHFALIDNSSSTDDNYSSSTQEFQPLTFIDKSPMSVTGHPQPIPQQTVLVLSNSPITCTDTDEDILAAEPSSSEVNNHGQVINTEKNIDAHLTRNMSDVLCPEEKISAENAANSLFYITLESQLSSEFDTSVASNFSDDKSLLLLEKDVPGQSSSWSEKALNLYDKLAFQVSNRTLESTGDQKDGSPKLLENSPRSTFSPLRTPATHIFNFFNYTSSLFQRPGSVDKDDSMTAQSFSSEDKSRFGYLPSSQFCLKTDFLQEDVLKLLGPDPRGLLVRSDSIHFEDAPLYLQIRRGVRKNLELYQPRAFDHWNTSPLIYEYWFVVPREMADKLYNFLMTWQPDAYGDEEETEPRGRFFYDVHSQEQATGVTFDSSVLPTSKRGLQMNCKEVEKAWEILSKEEVYRTESELLEFRQDTIDESSIPELIGSSVIISSDHILAIMKSLPRNMSVGYNWELVYATHKHGYSLQNMYMRTEHLESDMPVLLFIMDTSGAVFGAFLSNTIRTCETFYGSGATFLFTFYPEFKKFSWCGDNQFFMHGTKDFFAVGSGEGMFGLWVDGSLDKGRSHPCTTFCNDVLAKEEDFRILQLEVWKFVDSSMS